MYEIKIEPVRTQGLLIELGVNSQVCTVSPESTAPARWGQVEWTLGLLGRGVKLTERFHSDLVQGVLAEYVAEPKTVSTQERDFRIRI